MNQSELNTGALVGLEDTQHSSNSVTAPAANANVAGTTCVVTPGRWEFDVTVSMSGTAETSVRNLKLVLGATGGTLQTGILSVPGTTTYRFRQSITGKNITDAGAASASAGVAAQVQAVGAATAGAIYTVSIRATKIGG